MHINRFLRIQDPELQTLCQRHVLIEVCEVKVPVADLVQLFNMGGNLNPVIRQHLPADGTRRHKPGRDPSREVAAATVILVAGERREIRMTRPQTVLQLVVIRRALDLVFDHQRHGGPGCPAFKHPGKHLYLIRFVALGGDASLCPAPVHVLLQPVHVHRQSRRQAGQHRADGPAVAFPENRELQQRSEGVTHGPPPCVRRQLPVSGPRCVGAPHQREHGTTARCRLLPP